MIENRNPCIPEALFLAREVNGIVYYLPGIEHAFVVPHDANPEDFALNQRDNGYGKYGWSTTVAEVKGGEKIDESGFPFLDKWIEKYRIGFQGVETR